MLDYSVLEKMLWKYDGLGSLLWLYCQENAGSRWLDSVTK
jgi:hypothetical protein